MPDTLPSSPFDSTIDKVTLGNILSAIDQRRQARDAEEADGQAASGSTGQRGRLVLLAEKQWIERVRQQARRRGMTLSAYLGQAVNRQLQSDETDERSTQRGAR